MSRAERLEAIKEDQVTRVTYETRASRDGEVLFFDFTDGPSVAVQRDPETQRWGVYVNTEELDGSAARSINPDGSPQLDIYLNDATLYDATRGINPDAPAPIDLSDEEMDLLIDALDSHQYWQLAPETRRNDGNVLEPLTDEERACDALAEKLGKLKRPAPAEDPATDILEGRATGYVVEAPADDTE